MANIHPLAVVSPDAQLGHDVVVGPFCVVEADVKIGAGSTLASHSVVKQGVELGENNHLHEYAVVGGAPQHLAPPPKLGRVKTGPNNVFRENVTVHRAVQPDKTTVIGSNCYLMNNAHVGHDCVIGDHVIMASCATLGGHVVVEERAFISGLVAVHQFCRIGRFTMIGGSARVVQDVPPFVMIDGTTNCVVGLNRVGLKRNGYTTEDFIQLKAAYRLIFRSGLRWVEVLERLKQDFSVGPASPFHAFLTASTRGMVHERRSPRGATVKLDQDASNEEPARETVLRVRAG